MLDLGRFLRDRKKQVEGIQSQLNPLDGNKTYNTVINNRQPTGYSAPAQRTRQPGQTTQQLVDNSYGTGLSAVTNRFKDLLDGNTQADNIRRYAQSGLNESYDQQQKRLTNQAINTNEGRNGINQFSAGSLSGVTDFFGKTPGSLAQLQGRVANATNSIDNPVLRTATKLVASPGTLFQGKKQADRQIQAGKDMNSFVENKKQQSGIGQRKDDNSWIYGAGNVGTQLPAQLASGPIGLIGQTSQMGADEANKAEASGRSNNYALTVAAAQAIPSYLSEKWGLDRFLPGEGSGSNMAINAVKRFATEGGQEAQQQFTQNLIANKLYDPTQGLKDGVLQSGVLGGLAGGFGSVATDSFDAPAGSLREKIRGAKQANNIRTDQRQIARPEEARVLSDYQDTLLGNIQSGSLINQIHRDARVIADKLGVDITSGSTRDINDRINAVLEQPLQQQNIQDPVVTNMPVYQQADPRSMIERMKVAKERVLNPQKMNDSGYIRVPGQDTELMVTHNLSAENFAKAQELGGIPQASVGIVDPKKYAIDGFGDITLVGNNNLVDPTKQGTRTFASDAYTPRQPQSQLKRGADTKQRLSEYFGDSVKKYGDNKEINLDAYDSVNEALYGHPAVMGKFLEENGIKPNKGEARVDRNTLDGQIHDAGLSAEYRVFLKEKIDGGLGDLKASDLQGMFMKEKGIKPKAQLDYNDIKYNLRKQITDNNLNDQFSKYTEDISKQSGATSKIFGGTTATGSQRWLDETMDNVLKIMRKSKTKAGEQGWGATGSMASTKAAITKEYRSIDQIVADRGRLTDTETMEATKELLQTKMEKLQSKLEKYAQNKSDNQFTEYDSQMEAINDYIVGGKGKQWFSQKFENVPDSVAKELDSFRKELQDAPTEYFESVSDRAVKLNEFEQALIPESVSKAQREDIVARLNKEGIQPRFYKDGQRQQALQDLMEEDNAKRNPTTDTKQGGYIQVPAFDKLNEKINGKESPQVGKTDDLETLKSNLDKTRQQVRELDTKLSAEFTSKSKGMTDAQKAKLQKEYQAKFEASDVRKQQNDTEASIESIKKSEVADTKTSSEVERLVKESYSQNDYDKNSIGYFVDLSKENIKNVTPLKGIDDYGDSMYVNTDAGVSNVKIQDWSESGQGFRVSNGNGNEIARFNTDAEARDFAKKALTIENEAARQGKRVILSGSIVENRTQSKPSTPKTVEGKTGAYGGKVSDSQLSAQITKLDSTIQRATERLKTGTASEKAITQSTLDTATEMRAALTEQLEQPPSQPKKPIKPLSQPVDNTPAIAKQVTKKTTPKPDKIAEALGLSAQDVATSTQEQYNRAATNSTSGADMKKLIESFGQDNAVTEAAKKAVQTGKQLDFYAKKDANDRGVGIERFDPKYHRIESGYVVDKKGNILGNHISVDETGIQVNVGGKIVNMEGVLGDVNQWGNRKGVTSKALGNYRLSETMNRNIDNSAPTKEIANATKQFLWGHKVKSEANMRTELDTQYKDLGNRVKNTNKAKPRGVSSTQWKDDIFGVMNGDLTDAQIKSKYDAKPAHAILNYKNETRAVYDSLLQRINTERVKFGQEEIQPRKDYITHLQEMKGSKSFVQEVAGQMRNSFADEGMARTRGTVPGDIAGRTEGFKPISKYNPYLQQRTGTKSLRDPYVAVQEYLQPALYNIHMTESGARARAVESAFRTAEQLKRMNPDQYLKESNTILDKYKKASPDNAKLITGFQEYANAIAGKTQRFDRQITDSSEAGRLGLKGWQGLQRIGGRGTILGNLSSVLAQPLNLTMNIADAGGINSVRGIAESLGDGGDIEKSNFIRARQTEPTKPIRGKGEKANDAGGFLLQQAELASVKLIWHTQHQKALQAGFKGQEAISQADLNTERVVAGRGIADKPELYRSTAANGILQYTLEVNAQNKAFWQDLNTTQKMKFMVAASATNALMGAITGFEPLPDFLKAIFETGKDFLDDGNDESGMSKAVHGGQRLLDQYASMNPLIGAPANALLPQSTRKSIFGSDGDTGRYPGGSAPIGVIKGAVDAGSNLAKTEYAKAAKAGVKLLPGGNQIKKTVTGAQAIADGQTEGSKLQAAKALAFGPNAINTDTAKTAQPWRADTKAAAKTTGELGTASDVEEILKGQFDTKEGRAFLALKDEDKKLKAESDPAIKEMYDQWQTTKRINKKPADHPEGLSKESKDILDWQAKRTVQQREKLAYSQNDYDFKLAKAKYEENKLNGTISRADDINAQQALRKAAVGADFTKDTRESYNALSKAELQALAENDPNGKKIWEDALAYGDALVKAGLTKKNKLRTGSGGGRGGRGSKANTSLLNFYKLQAQTSSDLQKLLAGTSFKGKTSVSSPKTGKVAQRRITVNTKA